MPPRRRFRDPIHQHRVFHLTESRVAIAGHPVHAMLVAFPIALGFSTLAADALYWWSGDDFWLRAGLWAAGGSFVMGLLAGLTGLAELLLVAGIRIRAASWTHSILAVMLLGLLGVNWGLRLQGGEILPWGILLSALSAALIGMTGWHGGKLVFDYGLGGHEAHGAAPSRTDKS
ncbi:DUF2231 domain-containing protein [Pararhodobacter zhoushanensis]|uniref:DUF2231 domain-containing protein n=1 Tax=Pararhodobacter zhoushanensis TaxID=2479545 RepID=UPI000F8D8DCF|nr:DUF2231 domain-containing protein [Pararhodobacter zhoushanensis]